MYVNDGWWFGHVVHKEGDRYIIYYEDQNMFYSHALEDIRLNLEWYQGAWMCT